MKLFLKRLWAYVQITTPVLFVGAIITVLAAVNIPARLAARCNYYVEVCDKDTICTYTVVGRNDKQIVVEVIKWNQVVRGQEARYLATYPTADWNVKTTDYAVCSKTVVYPPVQ